MSDSFNNLAESREHRLHHLILEQAKKNTAFVNSQAATWQAIKNNFFFQSSPIYKNVPEFFRNNFLYTRTAFDFWKLRREQSQTLTKFDFIKPTVSVLTKITGGTALLAGVSSSIHYTFYGKGTLYENYGLVGALFQMLEGGLLLKGFSVLAGRAGTVADLSKAKGSYLEGNYKDTAYYGFFGLANAVTGFYNFVPKNLIKYNTFLKNPNYLSAAFLATAMAIKVLPDSQKDDPQKKH